MTRSISQVQVSILAQIGSGFRSAFQAADREMSQFGKHAQDLQRKIGDIGAYRRQENALKESAAAYNQARKRAQELRAAIDKAGGDGNAAKVRIAQTAQTAKEAAAAMDLAKAKALTLGDALAKTSKPTAEQRAALKAAKDEARQAAAAYKTARDAVAQLEKEERTSTIAIQKNRAELARTENEARRLSTSYQQARARLAEMGRELQRNGVNVSHLSTEYRRLQGELTNTNNRQRQAESSLQRQQRLVQGMRTATAAMATSWDKIKGAAAGAIAAGAVLAQPAKKALTYEEQLSRLAATAGTGKSVEEKEAMRGRLSDMVETARQQSGGGSRDDVATALNTLVASGKFDSEGELKAALNSVSKGAFASGATAEDIAKLAIAAKQFGISVDDAIRIGHTGGKSGRFELKDQAKYLPEQLAKAKTAGFSGVEGYKEIIALNQVSMNTAGDTESAGRNMINLLQKINSAELSDRMAKIIKPERGDPTKAGKKGRGEFDWSTYLQQNQGKGISTIESVQMILERQFKGNKRYQELTKQASSMPEGDAKKAVLQSVSSIIEGSEVGKLFTDMQVTSMVLARMQSGGELARVKSAINAPGDEIAGDSEFLRKQNFAKTKMLEGNIDRANENTYGEVGGALSTMLDKINGATQEFPRLTTAVYGAATALAAIAAAGIGAGAMAVLGRGGGAAAAGGGAAAAGTAAAGGVMAGLAGRALPFLKGAAVSAAGGYVVDAAAGAMGAGGNKIDEKQDDKNWNKMSTGQKVMSSIPRSIEGIGSLLFLDNLVNSAKASRIKSETEMVGGGGGGKAAVDSANTNASNTATAAQEAAKSAQEAAKAATIKPNVNISNSYSVKVDVAQPGALELGNQLDKALRDMQRKSDAETRAKWMGNPAY